MKYKHLEKIYKFMYGRYGTDDLCHFLCKLCILLLIINLFIKNNILDKVELLILVLIFFRMFSKNIYRRSAENKVYLKIKRKILNPFKNLKNTIIKKINQIKDKNYIYKKCHKCGTILRLPLPSKYGIKKVKCPKCKRKFRVLCLKKEKIEIIKKNKRRRK